MERTVDGDVQRGTHAERDLGPAMRDQTVSHQRAADAQSQAQEPLAPEMASHQVTVGGIPMEPPDFRPRAGLLAQLDQSGTRISVIHAETGLRGLGATQLAAAYARAKLAAGWRLVAWVSGADTGSLQAGLAAVADATGLTDDDPGWEIADAGAAVRHWLETDGDRCLLVFDNVSDPEAVQPFVPAHGAARVLITSTRQSAASLGRSVPVDVLSAEEASAFLDERTGLDDEAGAAAVAAALGHLPLALALAAPVITGHRVGYARYLDWVRAWSDVSMTGDDGQPYPPGVARAVLLAWQAVRAADRTGVCIRVMQIMSVLSEAGVRRDLLHAAGQTGVLASVRRRVAADLVDRALEWLGDRSLLTFSLDGQTIIVHPLVAQVIRNGLARKQKLTAVCEAAAFMLDGYSRALVGSQDRRAIREIPQQVTALLTSLAGPAAEADEELAWTLLRLRFIAFYHLLELGDSTPQAIAAGESLVAELQHLLGPDHPDTVNSQNSLAAAYLAAGRVAEAIALFEQALAARQRLLGPDDPETLTSQNNLASAYQDARRTAEAIRLYELNLEARERLLGPDHPSTLNSRGNLAASYLAAGQAAEAVPLLEKTLHGREQVLGPDHPDTRTSRKNLAKAYRTAGRTAEAISLEKTLEGRERILVPGRPGTRTSMENLANAYRDESQVAEAIPPAGLTSAAWKSQPPAGAAGQRLRSGFRRPPADPASRMLPPGFRRPPADPARPPLPGSVESPSARSADHSPPARAQGAPPEDTMYDREVVTAIAARDPAGIAMAYDRYAAALYGYCHWMLHESAEAAAALQDTFVIAAATLSDLPEPSELRPRLFALARNECRRRSRTTSATRDENAGAANQRADASQRTAAVSQSADAAYRPIDAITPSNMVSQPNGATHELTDATLLIRAVSLPTDAAYRPIDGTMPIRIVSQPAEATDGLAQDNSDPGQGELRALIRSILAELKPREREVIELSFRHDLDDNDLAIALGMSQSRARALASRAHGRLEEALGTLHITFTRREACPALGELLTDWDGQLTQETRDLVGWHMEGCRTCASHGRGALSPVAFSRLLPLAPLPPELREQILSCCSSTSQEAVAYRRRVVRRAESTWPARFSQAIRLVSWDSIRAHPGMAIAAVAVAAWVVAAVSVTLLAFAGR